MVSPATLSLLRTCEGCRLTAYQDQRGVWTIGYGHTTGVTPGLTWDQSTADSVLASDIAKFAVGVAAAAPVSELTDNEFGAMVSLAYNIGLAGFSASSVCHLLDTGEFDQIPDHIRLWDKTVIGGVLTTDAGLVWRRSCEVGLWELPDGAVPPNWETFR